MTPPSDDQGWVLVPRKASAAMLDESWRPSNAGSAHGVWDAMLSAAPAPTDEVVEAMAKAHYESLFPDAAGRMSWEHERELPNYLATKLAAMRAALAALGGGK